MADLTPSNPPPSSFPNFTKLPIEIQELIYRHHLTSSIFTIFPSSESNCHIRYENQLNTECLPPSMSSPAPTSSPRTEAQLYDHRVSYFFSHEHPNEPKDTITCNACSDARSWNALDVFLTTLARDIRLPRQSTSLVLSTPLFHFTSLEAFTNILRLCRLHYYYPPSSSPSPPPAPLPVNPQLNPLAHLAHLSLRMTYPRTWRWDYRSWETCLTRPHLPRLQSLTLWFPDFRYAFETHSAGRPRVYYLKTVCNVKGLRELSVNCEAETGMYSETGEELWIVALGEVLRRNCCLVGRSGAVGGGREEEGQGGRFDERISNVELRERIYRAMRAWLEQ